MSTHNLCFGSEIRRNCKPLYTPVLLYKSLRGYTSHRHIFLMVSVWLKKKKKKKKKIQKNTKKKYENVIALNGLKLFLLVIVDIMMASIYMKNDDEVNGYFLIYAHGHKLIILIFLVGENF